MNGVNWFAVLLAGAVGAIAAVIVEYLLTGRREATVAAIAHRNILLAYHAEIASNIRRLRKSALLPVPLVPFEEPVAEHLASGAIFYAVADYDVVTTFNESVRARRYLDETLPQFVLAPKFQEWDNKKQERFIRRMLLMRLPSWAYLARWLEERFRMPTSHRVDFSKLQDLVKSYDADLEDGLRETGSSLLAEQWKLIRHAVGLD